MGLLEVPRNRIVVPWTLLAYIYQVSREQAKGRPSQIRPLQNPSLLKGKRALCESTADSSRLHGNVP